MQVWLSTRLQRIQSWVCKRLTGSAAGKLGARIGLVVILCALALVALGQLDGLLKGMRVPGRAAGASRTSPGR
ncbi:MAG TPA: hypothetical protein VIG64_05585 [Actinomycetota bacterium]